jgi:hypothetical protein
MRSLACVLTVTLVLTGAGAQSAHGQRQKLTPRPPHAVDEFGWAVSLQGDVAVVGAPAFGSANKGATFVYRRRSSLAWELEASLVPAAGLSYDDNLGRAVCLDGDSIITGASGDSDFGVASGAAYVFRWDGSSWTEEVKLVASDAGKGDYFGRAVGLSGDLAVVGTDYFLGGKQEPGAAYIFRRLGSLWSEEAKLTPAGGGATTVFGSTAACDGDRVVISAPGTDDSNGAVYVYHFDGSSWNLESELTLAIPSPRARFGTSLALQGDTLVVGSPDDRDDNGVLCGSATIFHRTASSWLQIAKLTPRDPKDDQRFAQVSLSGDTIVVGALGDKPAGKAYVFRRSGSQWYQQMTLVPRDAVKDDLFGWAVGVSGDFALVSSLGADQGSLKDVGAAYLFDCGLPISFQMR